jgi:hypothetical protein
VVKTAICLFLKSPAKFRVFSLASSSFQSKILVFTLSVFSYLYHTIAAATALEPKNYP